MATEYQQVGTEVKYREETQTYEQDLGYETVPICKPKFIFFEMVGLRPSTPHWVFFDGIEVTKWVNTSFNLDSYNNAPINSLLRNPGDNYITATSFPAAQGGPTNASGPVSTDASGTLSGAFYLQSNDALSFKTGTKKLTAIDISILDKALALSYAEGQFVSTGVYEVYYEESIITNVAYDAPIYDWVTVPDPVAPANSSSDNDRGNQTMVTVLGHDGYNYYVTQSHADQMGYGVGNWGASTGTSSIDNKQYGASDNDGGGASNAENSSCVVATYASEIGSTVLNAREKRKAEVWCIRKFHGKWWGEALRRGYRHLGRQAINNGTADRHFQEFIDYVNFGSGKHRNFRSGLNFVYRTLQFITLGLTIAKREK